MTWRAKLVVGAKENPPYRKDLAPIQMPPPELPAGPGRDPWIPMTSSDRTRVEPPAVRTPDDLPPQD